MCFEYWNITHLDPFTALCICILIKGVDSSSPPSVINVGISQDFILSRYSQSFKFPKGQNSLGPQAVSYASLPKTLGLLKHSGDSSVYFMLLTNICIKSSLAFIYSGLVQVFVLSASSIAF